jgi:hypothetical protein
MPDLPFRLLTPSTDAVYSPTQIYKIFPEPLVTARGFVVLRAELNSFVKEKTL